MFKNKVYEKSAKKLGFVLLPLVEQNQIEELKKLYRDCYGTKQVEGMYVNHNKNKTEESINISKKILDIVYPFLCNQFENFCPFIGHFVVKGGNTQNEFSLHQDWNIVDENKYESYHIWIPLSISHEKNGGMFALPNSHKFFNNHRSGSFGSPVIPSNNLTELKKTKFIIPPGSALVWHDATFHGSYPNQSNDLRISVVIVIHQKTANTEYFHYNNKKNETEVYNISPKSLLTHLHELEKGGIPYDFKINRTEPKNIINNSEIDINCLITKASNDGIMYPIIKSDYHQNELNNKGYVVFKNVFSQTEVSEAIFFLEKHTNFKKTIHKERYTSMEDEEFDKKVEISQKIAQLLQDSFQNIFFDLKIAVLLFFIKMPKSDGDINFHSDTSLLLNHGIEPNYGLWLPLQDVNENNGTLKVVPKSHTWYNGVYTNSSTWPFLPYMDRIEKKAICLNLKAGDLVVFDNRLIHGSSFNNTEKPRVCIAGRVTHKHSQYYSFFKENPDDEFINVYEEADDFYLNEKFKGDKEISPTGRFIGKVYQPKFNEEEFLRKLNE